MPARRVLHGPLQPSAGRESRSGQDWSPCAKPTQLATDQPVFYPLAVSASSRLEIHLLSAVRIARPLLLVPGPFYYVISAVSTVLPSPKGCFMEDYLCTLPT